MLLFLAVEVMTEDIDGTVAEDVLGSWIGTALQQKPDHFIVSIFSCTMQRRLFLGIGSIDIGPAIIDQNLRTRSER